MSVGSAFAATQSSTLNVRLEVVSGCTANLLDGTTLDFGQVAGTPSSDILRSARVSVSCTGRAAVDAAGKPTVTTPVTLGLNYGVNATDTQRNLRSGADKIPYYLYKNSYYGDIWGLSGSPTTSGGPLAIDNLTDSTPHEVTIFGVVKKGEVTGKPVGVYTDLVQLVLTY
ncbi:MAG: spore coat protein U domain-containing protein [Phyllobacterium sp.]|uniref:Csu type fimbrial protein n=1 Tax=Phyllobacterium sp. TaxID=1871046 RepID=UPI0030F0A88E